MYTDMLIKNGHSSKILIGISSNFLHSIKTSHNLIKIWGDFGPIFWKKSMGYTSGYFQKMAYFLKWP